MPTYRIRFTKVSTESISASTHAMTRLVFLRAIDSFLLALATGAASHVDTGMAMGMLTPVTKDVASKSGGKFAQAYSRALLGVLHGKISPNEARRYYPGGAIRFPWDGSVRGQHKNAFLGASMGSRRFGAYKISTARGKMFFQLTPTVQQWYYNDGLNIVLKEAWKQLHANLAEGFKFVASEQIKYVLTGQVPRPDIGQWMYNTPMGG